MTLHKAARPCGIIGGAWAILLSLLVFLLTPGYAVVSTVARDGTGQVITSVTEKTFTSGNLPLLIFSGVIAIMGMLALAAILVLGKKPRLRNIIMLGSIAGIIICGLFSLGIILLPAVILLVIAAIGMKGAAVAPSREAV